MSKLTLQNLEEWLLFHLNSTIVWDDGTVLSIRRAIGEVEHSKVEIRLSEHAPPHFHVISDKMNASFSIKDCSLINGKISRKDELKIKDWYRLNKDRIIKCWNETRPANCPVGAYK